MMRWLALAALAVAACGGGDASPPDALDAASTGATWRLETRPIDAIYRYRDSAPLAAGRSIRIAYEYVTPSCDVWAMPRLGYEFERPDLELSAQVFTRTPSCSLTTRQVRITTLQLAEGTWTILGGAGSTATPLVVTVGPAPSRACGGVATCALDCDCDAGAGERCIGAGAAGTTTICAPPCELDRDCGGGGACVDDDVGAFHGCSGGTECDDVYPCAGGFTCTAGACTPAFTLSAETRHPCGGDGDCAAPLRCVEATAGVGPSRCEQVCRTGGPWCGDTHACDLAEHDADGLAVTDSICVARP